MKMEFKSKKLKSKRAWIAVTEAVTGIVILFVFVMLALSQISKQDTPKIDFNALFISQIENNQSLRAEILAGDELDVNNSLNIFLSKFNNYNLDVCIRDMQGSCLLGMGKEVTALDYFVSDGENTKKLRIFLWKNE